MSFEPTPQAFEDFCFDDGDELKELDSNTDEKMELDDSKKSENGKQFSLVSDSNFTGISSQKSAEKALGNMPHLGAPSLVSVADYFGLTYGKSGKARLTDSDRPKTDLGLPPPVFGKIRSSYPFAKPRPSTGARKSHSSSPKKSSVDHEARTEGIPGAHSELGAEVSKKNSHLKRSGKAKTLSTNTSREISWFCSFCDDTFLSMRTLKAHTERCHMGNDQRGKLVFWIVKKTVVPTFSGVNNHPTATVSARKMGPIHLKPTNSAKKETKPLNDDHFMVSQKHEAPTIRNGIQEALVEDFLFPDDLDEVSGVFLSSGDRDSLPEISEKSPKREKRARSSSADLTMEAKIQNALAVLKKGNNNGGNVAKAETVSAGENRDRPFKCKLCGFAPKVRHYDQMQKLRTHSRTHTQAPFECAVEGCDFASHLRSRVETHLAVTHNFKRENPGLCENVTERDAKDERSWKKLVDLKLKDCFGRVEEQIKGVKRQKKASVGGKNSDEFVSQTKKKSNRSSFRDGAGKKPVKKAKSTICPSSKTSTVAAQRVLKAARNRVVLENKASKTARRAKLASNKSRREEKKHGQLTADGIGRPYKCTVCGFAPKMRKRTETSALVSHVRAHLPPSWECPVPKCQLGGSNYRSITKMHIQNTHHVEKEPVNVYSMDEYRALLDKKTKVCFPDLEREDVQNWWWRVKKMEGNTNPEETPSNRKRGGREEKSDKQKRGKTGRPSKKASPTKSTPINKESSNSSCANSTEKRGKWRSISSRTTASTNEEDDGRMEDGNIYKRVFSTTAGKRRSDSTLNDRSEKIVDSGSDSTPKKLRRWRSGVVKDASGTAIDTSSAKWKPSESTIMSPPPHFSIPNYRSNPEKTRRPPNRKKITKIRPAARNEQWERPHKCKLCGFAPKMRNIFELSVLKSHVRSHMAPTFMCSELNCAYVGSNYESIVKWHIGTTHPGSKAEPKSVFTKEKYRDMLDEQMEKCFGNVKQMTETIAKKREEMRQRKMVQKNSSRKSAEPTSLSQLMGKSELNTNDFVLPTDFFEDDKDIESSSAQQCSVKTEFIDKEYETAHIAIKDSSVQNGTIAPNSDPEISAESSTSEITNTVSQELSVDLSKTDGNSGNGAADDSDGVLWNSVANEQNVAGNERNSADVGIEQNIAIRKSTRTVKLTEKKRKLTEIDSPTEYGKLAEGNGSRKCSPESETKRDKKTTVTRRQAESGPRPLMCKICGFAPKLRNLGEISALRSHARRHMAPQFRCTQCSYESANASTTRSHMLTHGISSEEPALKLEPNEYRKAQEEIMTQCFGKIEGDSS